MARMMAVTHRARLLPVAETATATDGTFALGLQSLSEKKYEVRVSSPAHAEVRLGDLQIQAGEWYDAGQIILHAGATIRGRITVEGTELPVPQAFVALETGTAFEDAIRGLSADEGGLSTNADANGFYEIRHAPRLGLFSVSAVAPGFARITQDRIEMREGTIEINLGLPSGLSIRGTVLDETGSPVANARCEAWPLQGDARPRFARTDGQGCFEVIGMREGDSRFLVKSADHQPLTLPSVAAGTADLRLTLRRRGQAEVRVLRPDGTVVRDFLLSLRRYFPENGGEIGKEPDVPDQRVRLASDQDSIVVRGIDRGLADMPNSYAVQVQADGFAKTLSAPFSIAQDAAGITVEVTLTPGATVRGRIVDESGSPVAGATVTTQTNGAVEDNPVWRMLSRMAPDKITKTSTQTGNDGTFELSRLAFGAYQLQVTHPEFCETIMRDVQLPTATETALAPWRLLRGAVVQGTATLNGKPQAQIHVVLSTPATGAPAASGGDGAVLRIEAVTNNDGRYVLPRRVPVGTYELRAGMQVGTNPHRNIFEELKQMQRSLLTVTISPGQQIVERDFHITDN
jgi:hypothetical protein